MKNRKYIGELEEVIMLTIGILDADAYGLAIKKDSATRLARNVSMGAMHTGLYRLEDKGYVTSQLGEATSKRGGKPKRFYRVTMLGQQVLHDTMNSRRKLWGSIPEGVFNLTFSS